MNSIWLDIPQNSEQWFAEKLGRVGASSFSAVMAKHDKGIWGKVALQMARDKAKERVTGITQGFKVVGDQFDRGHRLEPVAIAAYEHYTGLKVTNGGIYISGSVNASPDGHTSTNGLIEIKSRTRELQLKRLRNMNVDPSAYAQIQGNLMLSGKKYCDFISYSEEFEDGEFVDFTVDDPRKLLVVRVLPDIAYMNILESRLQEFDTLIENEVQKL